MQFQESLLKVLAVAAFGVAVIFFIPGPVSQLLFALGLVIGWLILFLDTTWGYRWYNQNNQRWLLSRSPVFLLTFLGLWLFMMTSSGSLLGVGIVQAMGITYLVELLLRANNPDLLKAHFLQGVELNLTQRQAQLAVVGGVLWLMITSLMMLR